MKKNHKYVLHFLGLILLFGMYFSVHFSATSSVIQSRSHEEWLDKMMDSAGVKLGMKIGEIGSGGSLFTFRMAERVGRGGRIYANDIDKKYLDSINRKEIQNIVTVLGEVNDPVFPVKNLDMIIMKAVFHDLENPLSMLENIKKYLKPGASLVLIDQLPFEGLDFPYHVMSEEQILETVDKSSFSLAHKDVSLGYRWVIYILEADEDKARNVWTIWLDEFRALVKKTEEIHKDTNLSSVKKRVAWERVLDSHRDNNPNSEEDEILKEYINKKIELLRGQERNPSVPKKETYCILNSRGGFAFHLRSEYKSIDEDDISKTYERLGFESKAKTFADSGDFQNKLEASKIDGDDVVVDKASGLIWHQSGSEEPLDFFSAQEWIDDLNIQRYGGYSDWRLPTTEEAISLLEVNKMNGEMKINPVFSSIQRFIWTGDAYYPGRVWLVVYYKMARVESDLKANIGWIRPVRSASRSV